MADISSDSETEIYEVKEILNHKGRGKGVRYLVRWEGYGEEEDSWEPIEGLKDAKEVVEKYRLQHGIGSTPRRSVSKEQGSGDAVSKVTKTVIKTQTVTKTTSAKNTQVSMSETSSPENSPTVTRKSLRSQKTIETEVKPVENDTKKIDDTPSRLSYLRSLLATPCRMCPSFHLTVKDMPIMIFVTCLLVIASTFYIADN